VLVQTIILLFGLVIYKKIQRSSDFKRITAPVSTFPFSGKNSSKTETITVQEYDEREMKNFLKGMIIFIVVILFLHLFYDYVVPLFVQIVVAPIKLYFLKLFQIYILGETGPQYQRPFKVEESQFWKMLEQAKDLTGSKQQANKKKKKLKRPSEKALTKKRAELKG